MKECDFQGTAGLWHCVNCGFKATTKGRPRRRCSQAPAEKSRGLGDTIAKITDALGIPKCGGCAKRQAKLNALVPYST